MLTRVASALGLVLFTGCASAPVIEPLPADHPANPAAAEVEPPPPSQTLALNNAGVHGLANPKSTAANHPAGATGDGHAHHHNAEAQPQPRAADPDPGGSVTSNPHAHHGNHGGAAATRPATTQPLYVCPMHPEVVSSNPNDRCPKCGMKINKPLRPTSPPAQVPAAPAPAGGLDAHKGHGGH
jgi:hypothetical protein